jgi:hypothetical protein
VRPFALAALCLAGCIDTQKCHQPSDWKPCAGETAQPGASGTPPTVLALSLPTCAFVESPMVLGTLHASDPDADAQVLKASFYVGPRVDESEVQLPASDASAADWTDQIAVTVVRKGGGAPSEGTSDVRIKLTDRAGGQSAPFCGTLTLLK